MQETKISSGSYDLNKFLYGGYETDIVTTIYGKSGTGKTNLCLITAVSQAKKGKKIIFIDTEGGFSLDRVKQLSKNENSDNSVNNAEEVMKNIVLLKPLTFQEQSDNIASLLKEIKQKSNIGLIIVDGMTILYRLELAEASQNSNTERIRQINSSLARQLKILAELSRKHLIPILITNQVYDEFLPLEELKAGKKPQANMVGGDILKYWSKCHILLENISGKKMLALKKHRSLPEKTFQFQITNNGIRKRGWI